MKMKEAIVLLQQFKQANPSANKSDVQSYLLDRYNPKKVRSVFLGEDFSIRFGEANTQSFSNTVLSLSAVQKYDALPIVICIVRPSRLDFRLANATFLKRISHSSHKLRADNIRGSFLGHDIIDHYEGVPNSPEHFEELFAIHAEFSWEENVTRLVEATNAIVARSTRFEVSDGVLARLLEAPVIAAAAVTTREFQRAELKLSSLVELRGNELLRAAEIDNVNIRGNTIEQIITGEVNAHRLDDLVFDLPSNGHLVIDIKTKLLNHASAPKAYNIDKLLRVLAQRGNVFCFFFVGLDAAHHSVHTRLTSIFDPIILRSTRVQTHWAGRASRGVTQLMGDLNRIFARDYRSTVDIEGGQALLRQLVER